MKQDKGFKGVLPSIDHSKYPLSTKQEKTPHGHHQMVNTEIILIIFFAAPKMEKLYTVSRKKTGS